MGVGRCLSMAATQYAEVDNLNIADQVYGSGPVDLAYVPRLHNHVERTGTCWASPSRWTASPGSRASSRSTSAGAACRTRWPRRRRLSSDNHPLDSARTARAPSAPEVTCFASRWRNGRATNSRSLHRRVLCDLRSSFGGEGWG